MDNDYIKDVRRYGSVNPFIDEEGKRFNLSHDDDFSPDAMITNGAGDVVDMPLLRRKPCFGRPERFMRASIPTKFWIDDQGERRYQKTRCDECRDRSPGAYEACSNLITERIESAPRVKASCEAWLNACGNRVGFVCFTGRRGRLWNAFLQSIIDRCGWTNVNDDAVKLDALQRRFDERARRNAANRARRADARANRRGTAKPVTKEYLDNLQLERDRRAEHLKKLRKLSSAPRWLTRLPGETCERTADVWQARELLTRANRKCNGITIAEHLAAAGRSGGLKAGSLVTRVYEDLRRIAKLEDDGAGASTWGNWIYVEAPRQRITP